VPFYNVDNSVAMKLTMFTKHSEVMMAREVSALDVELVENVSMPCILSPNFLNVGIFEFVTPMMVFADFNAE